MAGNITVGETLKSKVIPFEEASEDIKKLARLSVTAREKAYCVYSNFAVGAAVLCENDEIFLGCNVENASYPVDICAEQTAISKAVSEGNQKIKALAVCANAKMPTPCGKCRQFIYEFSKDAPVYCVQPTLEEVLLTSVDELLPLGFIF